MLQEESQYLVPKRRVLLWPCEKCYQELLKEKSNPRLKGNRKGIIVKDKEFSKFIFGCMRLP